jgi:hypothetical protein
VSCKLKAIKDRDGWRILLQLHTPLLALSAVVFTIDKSN